MKQEHTLKIEPHYLKAKLAGDKPFEIRVNDRGYQKGDTVYYWGDSLEGPAKYQFVITYVTNYRQADDYVVFGERQIT